MKTLRLCLGALLIAAGSFILPDTPETYVLLDKLREALRP